MKTLFTEQEFERAKCKDLLPCQCLTCGKVFYLLKRFIVNMRNTPKCQHEGSYCSRSCFAKSNYKRQEFFCDECGVVFAKQPSQIRLHNFCSKSCAATYNNKHKTYGTRRSKLEKYIQEQLTTLYPDLIIEYNSKSAIGSELDIYIPSLQLAFELNGIYHFEPIHGSEKLGQIQDNDSLKFKACQENGISLCVVDTSAFKHFKEQKARMFLEIVTKIINDIR